MGYYGGDSCAYYSVSCGAYEFYGMPAGGGTSPNPSCTCQQCQSAAGSLGTYLVWTLEGPGSAGSYTPSQWGQAQADAAMQQRVALASTISTLTVFFDVESSSGGWGTNQTNNQSVLEAALATVVSQGQTLGYTFTPGVYISIGSSDNKWNYYFGASYVPSTPFVLWAALHQCYTCTQAASLWPDYYSSVPIHAGGQEIVIAQYYIGGGACSGSGSADLDYMEQNPQNGIFQPVAYQS